VLRHDDAQLATLAGSDVSAVGTVRIAWSDELGSAVLLADGLPAAPHGHAYELWMIGDGGPVAMDVLDDADDGRMREIIDVSARPQGWGLTIEPASGSPTPTGDVLYVATV
jgi:anti-sigma-K factor RskA